MDLPIKPIDLVTLIFISLLVIIIIFITLQRNIKRFKLRNLKDPHYLSCKSIPKELKDAIELKHQYSHLYREPPTLLTANYLNDLENKDKLFLIRMKAFESSKALEMALAEYGVRRPAFIKLENFIKSIINSESDEILIDLLNDFNKYFIWAMLDPMKFEKAQLRTLNKIINHIIERLALLRKDMSSRINMFRLDLNEFGDCNDFTRHIGVVSSAASNFTITSNRLIRENSSSVEPSTSYQNTSSLLGNNDTIKSKHKKKVSKEKLLKRGENLQDKELLLDDNAEGSFDSNRKSTKSSSLLGNYRKKEEKNQAADTSELIDDSESENIPLVTAKKSNNKKKSQPLSSSSSKNEIRLNVFKNESPNELNNQEESSN